MSAAAANGAHSRRQLLLLALLFFGPLLLAVALYYGAHWSPAGHANHGTLIDPPRPLAERALMGKWSMVYVGSGQCDADCRQTLYYMRQTHLGLGQLSSRMQRVFIVADQCCDRSYLARTYPQLTVLDASDAGHAPLLAAFPTGARASSIFIVDPRGNLMMRYDSHAPPEGLMADLKRLLNLSDIG